MFKLEKRPQQSQKWIYLSPFLAYRIIIALVLLLIIYFPHQG